MWKTPHLSVSEADKKCMAQINQVTNALTHPCGSPKGHGKLQSLSCWVDMFDVGLKQALHVRHSSTDTTVRSQLAWRISALMLTAPSTMAVTPHRAALPTKAGGH